MFLWNLTWVFFLTRFAGLLTWINDVTSQLRHFKKPKKNSLQAEKLMSLFVFFTVWIYSKLCIAEVAPMSELD